MNTSVFCSTVLLYLARQLVNPFQPNSGGEDMRKKPKIAVKAPQHLAALYKTITVLSCQFWLVSFCQALKKRQKTWLTHCIATVILFFGACTLEVLSVLLQRTRELYQKLWGNYWIVVGTRPQFNPFTYTCSFPLLKARSRRLDLSLYRVPVSDYHINKIIENCQLLFAIRINNKYNIVITMIYKLDDSVMKKY
jgi:hypothetical protein